MNGLIFMERRLNTGLHDPLKNITIRTAQIWEVRDLLLLFEGEVRSGNMLPRHPAEMRSNIDDWLVAVSGKEIVGCVSLVFFNDELCEVRSLAVHESQRGNGLGGALIRAALKLALANGMQRVLTLTRAVPLFEREGFRYDSVGNFPEKVWRDCRPCPLRHRCDEVALLYYLDEHPQPLNGKR